MNFPLVEITWRDAAGDSSWFDFDEIELEDEIAVSVGFLVDENERYIGLVQTRCPDSKEVNGLFQIPVANVIKRREIEPA